MIKEYFAKHNIATKDVPKGIIYYKAIGMVASCGIFACCYKYRPIKALLKTMIVKKQVEKFKIKYPNFYEKTNNFMVEKSKKISEWRIVKNLSSTMKLNSLKTVEAIYETAMISKLLLPITIPTQLWLTVLFIPLGKQNDFQLFETTN